MAGETSRPSGGSWRGGEGQTPRRGRDALWKRRTREPGAPGPTRSTRVLRAALACLVGIGLIVWLILMIQPVRPASVLLVGADYATNLAVPHNVYGWEGLRGVRELTFNPKGSAFWSRSKLGRARENLVTLRDAKHWDELIEDLRANGFRGETLILFLALHGASDASGHAYLLPDGATRPGDGVELATIIGDLKKLPSKKNKLLILEAAQVPSSWRLGVAHNNVARRLKELNDTGAIAEVPGLWVMSAADIDQRCWISDGMRQTVFSHYLIEGLRGAAAGDDGRVSLAELQDFVFRNVRNWVWDARAAVQEPLLLPERGKGRNPGAVVLALASDTPAPAAKNPLEPNLPKALEDRWREFDRLGKLSPTPAVYSPQHWAAYRATLVRYDQVVRAGGSAERRQQLSEELDHLRASIEGDAQERQRSLAQSGGNTLPSNALRGGSADTSSSAPLERLWAVADADVDKAIADYRKAEGGTSGLSAALAQGRAERFLIERGEDDPRANLTKAAARLERLKGPDAPLSAEAHFLIMLAQGRTFPPADRPAWFGDRQKQALAVRRLAERAALGAAPDAAGFTPSEQIAPWIASQVEQADTARRLGDDLLFASDESAWNDAQHSLETAGQGYKKALERAGSLQRAIALRDRALSDLPEYARWLAERPSASADDPSLKLVRDLAGKTQDLARRLMQPTEEIDLAALDRDIEAIRPALDQVSHDFNAQREQIERARQAQDWQVAAAAADAAPSSDEILPLRQGLWRRLANIAARDLEIDRPGLGKGSGPSGSDRLSDQIRNLRAAGKFVATGLSVFGRDLYEERALDENDGTAPRPTSKNRAASPKSDAEGFDDLTSRLTKVRATLGRQISSESELKDVLDPKQGNGLGVLAEAGAELGRRWRTITPAIVRLVNDGNLVLADRLSRQADGVLSDGASSGPEAASIFRSARLRDALAWLAHRTWLDHWYDTNPQAMPYYQAAGSRYLEDIDLIAQSTPAKGALKTPTVSGSKKRWPRSVESVQTLYGGKDELGFNQPPPPVLTSERTMRVFYELTGMDPQLAGAPVVWADSESSQRIHLDGPVAGQRIAWLRSEAENAPPKIAFAFSSPALDDSAPKLVRPEMERSFLTVSGFFRGRRFERRTEVLLYPVPETTVVVPPIEDRSASLAVRADRDVIERFGEGNGAITIILDCSGSMGKDVEGSKFHDARKALASVLRTVPRGTMVSIWTFSQEMKGYDRFDPVAVEHNRNPEATTRRVLGPARWDPSQIVLLDQQLDQIEPTHETPLVYAMDRAAEDLERFPGFKTLLVLTDGKDTRFATNAAFNPTKMSIPAYVTKRFARSGILINMIAFKIEDKELAEAQEQFADALRQLDPPGRFLPVNESQQLVDALRNSLQQKIVCQLKRAEGGRVDDLDVASPDESDRWYLKGVEPGRYVLQVRADQTWEKAIDLDPGDRLLVRLVSKPDGSLGIERAFFSDDFPTRKPFAESQGWRLAVLQNRFVPDGNRLQMLASLEPLEDPREYLALSRPRAIWFDLQPGAVSPPAFAIRWSPVAQAPAPIWRIDVPEWPPVAEGQGPSRPTLRAWWITEAVRSTTTVAQPEQFQTAEGIDRLEVFTKEGETVTIESVQVENHVVETRPGGPREPMPCLVFRIKYPSGKPYFIDPTSLGGLEIAGHEHRFYRKAGKYAGLFWPVSKTRVEAALKRFGLVSVNQITKDSESRKLTLEVKQSVPRTDDRGPNPLRIETRLGSSRSEESSSELPEALPRR